MSDQVSDTGIITKIEDNFATIAIDSTDDCKDCGIRFLCSPGSEKEKIIRLENTIDAKIGDIVTISEASNILLKLSILQYGLPLIGFLAGIFISYNLNINFKPIELFQFICGIIGLGIAGIVSYSIIKWIAKKPNKLYSVRKV
ncbi:MAG: SoxR reducing system RseC family protein [Candidatus Marinimicrobia bacterium]|nr:SoxR reducing system RseC family protein [Candidatus Neomarinimicrobiota bacterium]